MDLNTLPCVDASLLAYRLLWTLLGALVSALWPWTSPLPLMIDERKHELNAVTSLRLHWPEFVMEFTEMGLYLFFTCIFATLLQHPASPIRHLLANNFVRRACFGISVGVTIAAIVSTPWGKQSGGHLNPAMTFTFYRLGKVEFWDAMFYGVAQFAGATLGVAIATSLLLGALETQ